MKAFIPFTLFATILAASESSMLTIRSTVISTLPCPTSSSTSLYQNSTSTSPTSSVSVYNNSTSSATTLFNLAATETINTDSTESETESDPTTSDPVESTVEPAETDPVESTTDPAQTEDPTDTDAVETTADPTDTDPAQTADPTETDPVETTADPAETDPSSAGNQEDPVESSTESDPQTTSEDPVEPTAATEITPEDPTETVTDIRSTLVTITSCSNGGCTLVTQTSGVETSVQGDTTYTSLYPIGSSVTEPNTTKAPKPSATSTVTDFYTTVVTEYSCHDDACVAVSKTTGVTVITHADTVYTTFCPLTTESPTPRTTQVPTQTVNVITSNIITESNVAISTFVPQVNSTTTPTISTYDSIYEGSAAIVPTSAFGIIFSLIFFML
ncbi:uncharacterized protein SPAPADRAFT_58678 [Spathaspora passalidarum NRRL Y-27907]|uniref:Flo11 domain-containing protein n=1 Tax=Spathaspora passalidarum (strain NRRL Y-27907 / 11-Y1) TaxID=619300 RepID=G3AH13_SPAPN|nr:uncharacterized protein SPAPADRAFT_58678 [Spathaspora passalidarum NRRL Y-27907]EGW35443.1 hypothetical protein SPAPADRAFT_58678 [Spathaspora passalidarum NRRL Y-27907]